MTRTDTDNPTAGFEVDATGVLGSSRAALADVLTTSGLFGERPAEISRRLGIDKTLAWKVARFVREPDPLRSARHLPGKVAIETLLEAAAREGAEPTSVEAARDADRALRGFMKEHAGDQKVFEAMLGGQRAEDRVERENRRAYFRSGVAMWGVRARLQLLTLVLRPSESESGKIDVLQMGGLFDLERLRSDTPWIVRRLRASNDSEKQMFRIRREPLDATGARGEGTMPLMTRYCSTPLPELSQFEAPNGWVYDELVPGPVGRGGAVTCVMGEIHRAVLPTERSDENTAGRYTVSVCTPVEAVIFDLLLHESLDHFGAAETHVYGQLEHRPHAGGASPMARTMYEPEPARPLGQPAIVHAAREQQYADIVREGLDRAGWGDTRAFRGYRTEIEYPPFPCDFTMVCEIGAGR